MKERGRRFRRTTVPVRGGERARRASIKDLKVCFGPCRCYATGRKAKGF